MTQEIKTEEPKMIELLVVQTGRGKDGVMRHTIQEILAEETPYFYDFEFNLGGNKVSSGSFGVPFIVHPDPVRPIVGTVGLKENREQLLQAVEDYFTDIMCPSLITTIEGLSTLVDAINEGQFDITEIGGE